VIEAVALATTILLARADVVQAAAEIPTTQQPFAECVAKRESNGNPKARNRSSSAMGKYQWLDNNWRHGLAHMTAWRLKDHGLTRAQAREIRAWLRARPITKWPEPVQDVAFMASLNALGPWSGWRHWYLAGSRCNTFANS